MQKQTHIRKIMFCLILLRTHIVYPYVSEIYESILFLEYDSNVADILSGRANCQIKCNTLL